MSSGSERLIAKAHTCARVIRLIGEGGRVAYGLLEVSSYSLNADCCKKDCARNQSNRSLCLTDLHRF